MAKRPRLTPKRPQLHPRAIEAVLAQAIDILIRGLGDLQRTYTDLQPVRWRLAHFVDSPARAPKTKAKKGRR